MESRSIQLVKKLYEAKKLKEELEQQATDQETVIRKLTGELYSEMENDRIDKLEYLDLKFSKVEIPQFSLAGDNKGKNWDTLPEFLKFLEDFKLTDLMITKTGVNQATRNANLKRIYEDTGALPDFISVSFFNTVKTRKV